MSYILFDDEKTYINLTKPFSTKQQTVGICLNCRDFIENKESQLDSGYADCYICHIKKCPHKTIKLTLLEVQCKDCLERYREIEEEVDAYWEYQYNKQYLRAFYDKSDK